MVLIYKVYPLTLMSRQYQVSTTYLFKNFDRESSYSKTSGSAYSLFIFILFNFYYFQDFLFISSKFKFSFISTNHWKEYLAIIDQVILSYSSLYS